MLMLVHGSGYDLLNMSSYNGLLEVVCWNIIMDKNARYRRSRYM